MPDQTNGVGADLVSRARRLPYAAAVAVYLGIHVGVLVLVAVVDLFTHHGLVNDLSTWDGAWFLRAVHDGWPRHLPEFHGLVLANQTAFFPALPLVIRAGAVVTRLSANVVGLIVSGITGLVATVAVGHLTRQFTDASRAERAALLFAVSPGAFVFNLIYAEGIVITCVAVGLVALLRRRWWLAGLLGAIATATSPVGLMFAVSCLGYGGLVAWRERSWRPLVAPVLAPLGFVVWMSYLWAHTGNLMAWRVTERDGWNSFPSLAYPVRIIGTFVTNPSSPTMTGQILFWGTVVSIVGVVLMFKERQPIPVLLYGVAAVVFFAISSPVGLRPRFVMLAFPMTIAVATRWSGWRYRLALAVSLIALILMAYETLTSWAVFP